jgi:hypothetical protein
MVELTKCHSTRNLNVQIGPTFPPAFPSLTIPSLTPVRPGVDVKNFIPSSPTLRMNKLARFLPEDFFILVLYLLARLGSLITEF